MKVAKQNQLKLCVSGYKTAPSLVIGFGIKAPVSSEALKFLKNGVNIPLNIEFKTLRATLICYAYFLEVKKVLVETINNMAKLRVNNIDCRVINGEFFLFWQTQNSLSFLVRTLKSAIKLADFVKLFGTYGRLLSHYSIKKTADERKFFNKIAQDLNSEFKKAVNVMAVGKLKLDQTKLNDAVKKLAPVLAAVNKPKKVDVKAPKPVPMPVKENPPKFAKEVGLNAGLVEVLLGSSNARVCDSIVHINPKWKWSESQLERQLKNLKKLKDKDVLYETLGYMLMSSGAASPTNVSKLFVSKPNIATMKTLLTKMLKL